MIANAPNLPKFAEFHITKIRQNLAFTTLNNIINIAGRVFSHKHYNSY